MSKYKCGKIYCHLKTAINVTLTIQHVYCSKHVAHPTMTTPHTEDAAVLQQNITRH